ncbi:hypothetical protein CHUAL_000616 [Chamberlinius hualienensis]
MRIKSGFSFVIYAVFLQLVRNGKGATLQPEIVTLASLTTTNNPETTTLNPDDGPPTVGFNVHEDSMYLTNKSNDISTTTIATTTSEDPDNEEFPNTSISTVDASSLQRNLASHVSSNAAPYNNSALSYYNYPFHHFALPECATQQVCNAVYTRLDRINALCACPGKTGDPCSISFSSDDAHTIELVTDNSGRALTLIKTCEPIVAVRECRGSKDWALLALQNVRTGKSHYLVVCRCVHNGVLEGPIAHENPPYAKIPGIRVYGMICVRDVWSRNNQRQQRRRQRSYRNARNKIERRSKFMLTFFLSRLTTHYF